MLRAKSTGVRALMLTVAVLSFLAGVAAGAARATTAPARATIVSAQPTQPPTVPPARG